MKIIDFRFRPHTEAILNGIKNSAMFKASCEHMGFDKWVPEPLDKIVADVKAMGVEKTVIRSRLPDHLRLSFQQQERSGILPRPS